MIDQKMPEELKEKFKEEGNPTWEDWTRLAELISAIYCEGAEPLARNALLAIYTEGDASLVPRAVDRTVTAARERLSGAVSADTLARTWAEHRAHGGGAPGTEEPDPVRRIEERFRAALREALCSSAAYSRSTQGESAFMAW